MSDPIEILSQLFGTLKDASNRNEAATQRLIQQQMDLVGHIKAMPIEDIRTALDKHIKESRDTHTSILSKVTKMLIVVGVAVTISVAGYILIKYAAESRISSTWQDKYEQIEKAQEDAIDQKLKIMMQEIRREMNKLHDKEHEE